MSVRGLPTRNTSIVKFAWAPRSEAPSSFARTGSIPFRGALAEPRPRAKREPSSGDAVHADYVRRRKLEGRAAVAAARLKGARRRRLTASSPGSARANGLDLGLKE